jgi:hypothetical protein
MCCGTPICHKPAAHRPRPHQPTRYVFRSVARSRPRRRRPSGAAAQPSPAEGGRCDMASAGQRLDQHDQMPRGGHRAVIGWRGHRRRMSTKGRCCEMAPGYRSTPRSGASYPYFPGFARLGNALSSVSHEPVARNTEATANDMLSEAHGFRAPAKRWRVCQRDERARPQPYSDRCPPRNGRHWRRRDP